VSLPRDEVMAKVREILEKSQKVIDGHLAKGLCIGGDDGELCPNSIKGGSDGPLDAVCCEKHAREVELAFLAEDQEDDERGRWQR